MYGVLGCLVTLAFFSFYMANDNLSLGNKCQISGAFLKPYNPVWLYISKEKNVVLLSNRSNTAHFK